MKTNIDKLHELVNLRNNVGIHNLPRGCGKTRLLCHELAGTISVSSRPDIAICAKCQKKMGR
jgi:hypothetical protein